MRKRIIVTGHLGFIGSDFSRICKDQYQVIGLDSRSFGSMSESLCPDTIDIHGDIADATLVARIVENYKPGAIVNFAAESHVDRSISGDLNFWHSNVMGVRNLAEIARCRSLRLVHVSTDEVYGDSNDHDTARTEESSLRPQNPYAVTKAAADMLLLCYHRAFGLDVVITRGANTIGPRQFPEKAVPKAIAAFTYGRPFPLFKTPARRMWLSVHDHASGILRALELGKSGEIYNLAPDLGSESYTSSIIEKVRTLVGKGTVELVEDRKAYDLRYLMTNDKARRALGWEPIHGLDETLVETVNWYDANRIWLEKAIAQCEKVGG